MHIKRGGIFQANHSYLFPGAYYHPQAVHAYHKMGCFEERNGTPFVHLDPEVPLSQDILLTHWILNNAISFVSVVFNVCLWCCIKSHSGQMSKMRPLLKYSCFVDIMISILNLIVGPFLNTSHGHFSSVWNGLFSSDNPYIVSFGISLLGALTLGSWGCLPLQFIYRLDVIRSGRRPRGTRLRFYVCIGMLIMNAAAVCLFNTYMRTNDFYRLNAMTVLRNSGIRVHPYSIVGGYISDLKIQVYMYFFAFMMILAYTFIIYAEVLRHIIMKDLKQTMAFSVLELHRDMNRTFYSMAIIPLLTSLIPSVLINYTVNLCENFPLIMIFHSLLIILGPLLNATTKIGFIRPYRYAFLTWLNLDTRSTKIFQGPNAMNEMQPPQVQPQQQPRQQQPRQQRGTITTVVELTAPIQYTVRPGETYISRA